jgi:tRNA 2-thiocytidine biosynthesis protein TtcA
MKTEQLNRLQKRLRRKTGEAISDYHMIDDGDRIMVCLSGGKDSYTLLDMLLGLQRSAPVRFELVAVNLDQKQPGFPEHVLPEYLDKLGVEYRIVTEDTYSVVMDKIKPGKTMCSLCSRLRRGILYRTAGELGANKVALGHHMDDLVETLFLNMFHGSRLKTMPPKLVSDDRRNIVIRPLVYCREKEIARFARARNYPIIPCNLCGSQNNLQRVVIKNMLAEWEKQSPNRVVSIFKSMQRVTRSHLLDTDLYDFASMTVASAADLDELDLAFDPPPGLMPNALLNPEPQPKIETRGIAGNGSVHRSA